MIKNAIIGAGAVLLIIMAAVAYSFLKPAAEASAPIQAIPLELAATATTVAPTAAVEDVADEPSEGPAATVEAGEASAEAAPTEVPTEEAATEPAEETAAPVLFEIVQAESQARYIIDEVLRNTPTTVVGTTDQVAGQFAIDPATPTNSQLGVIQLNARTFQTDEGRRDNAVQNRILLTNQYEYITFEPVELVGLPDSVTVGESFSFQVVGNLTMLDTTREVTWDLTVTPVSEDRLEGTATTSVAYADWGIRIPQVPMVASVADDVRLELDFVAVAA